MMTRKTITNGLTVAVVAMGMMVGAANAAPWTPAEISSTINVLWLDAADTGSITDTAGAVSQWDDKSGNGKHVANASAANQPLTSTYSIDGKNVIRFDGNDTLETLGGAAGNPLGATIEDVSVHMVARTQTFSGWKYIMSVGNNVDRLAFNSGGTIEYKSRNQNIAGSWLPAVGTVFQGGYYGSTTEATMEAWHDGSKSGDAANVRAASSVAQGIVVGGRVPNSADSGLLDIAEFIVLKGVRDTDTQEKTEGYLAWKWGLEGSLPGGHPYKSAAPEGAPAPTPGTLIYGK